MARIPILGFDAQDFPPVEQALVEPNGLLAAGGDLSVQRLINAYRQGIFPWFEDGQPVLWWSPSPRAVLFPHKIHISRSLHKVLRKDCFRVTMDTAFDQVIHLCAQPRAYSDDTWITSEMTRAYCAMHQAGYAHSVEVWQGPELVGGLYGVALGRIFFGESMFSTVSNASKVAFVYLAGQLGAWGFPLIDCQLENPHLQTLGIDMLPRKEFRQYLHDHIPHHIPHPDGEEALNPQLWSLDWHY